MQTRRYRDFTRPPPTVGQMHSSSVSSRVVRCTHAKLHFLIAPLWSSSYQTMILGQRRYFLLQICRPDKRFFFFFFPLPALLSKICKQPMNKCRKKMFHLNATMPNPLVQSQDPSARSILVNSICLQQNLKISKDSNFTFLLAFKLLCLHFPEFLLCC